MRCLNCGSENSRVVDSRSTDEGNSIRRRRECEKCGKRFTTYEIIEQTPILVIKKDGGRQPFDIEKIKKGIIKSCEKRPVSIAVIEDIVNDIFKTTANSLTKEIKSSEIGQMVMDKLKMIDEISYIRFASVYMQLEDMTNFIKFLNNFKR